jgi:nicotinamidase-related amidase
VTVRVRFSPAPTGFLHVGSARAALFNWLYARHTGGAFVLRIEDTDTARTSEDHVAAIADTLRWLGLEWDEEHRQSDRFDQYHRVADDLLDRGLAYRCDCSQEAVKARAGDPRSASGYDGYCRDRDVGPGEGVVVRFRTPDEGETAWDDAVRGRVSFDNAVLEDFVIVRSSGTPMFHLANAYDDLDMGITHVVRGEDLVNTTPRVLLLREAMGATSHPVYAHLPLIVNEKRQIMAPAGEFRYRDESLPPIIANIVRVIEYARTRQRPIAYLQAVYSRAFAVQPPSLRREPDRQHFPCKPHSWGAAFIEPIRRYTVARHTASPERVIEKHTFDGFYQTELLQFLRDRQVQTVVLAGVETHVCVLTTAQSAAINQFKTIILEDCVWTASEELDQRALAIFRDAFGVTARVTGII